MSKNEMKTGWNHASVLDKETIDALAKRVWGSVPEAMPSTVLEVVLHEVKNCGHEMLDGFDDPYRYAEMIYERFAPRVCSIADFRRLCDWHRLYGIDWDCQVAWLWARRQTKTLEEARKQFDINVESLSAQLEHMAGFETILKECGSRWPLEPMPKKLWDKIHLASRFRPAVGEGQYVFNPYNHIETLAEY